MKIVFVTDVVYPYVRGGAEKRIYELSRRLAARDHEVHIYSIQWWDGPAVMARDGITYHGVCRPRALYVNGRRSIAEALWFAVCLTGPLLRERFDIIDCNEHPYFSLFSCKIARLLRGGRLFATWHEVWGSYWYEYIGIAGAAGRAVEWLAARMPDRLIAVSERTAADLLSMGIREDRITVVPNGIQLAHIRDVPASDEACDVIFAGRLIKDKHVDVLIRACAGTPMRLTVIGDGPERASLEALARELNVKATFTGFLDEDALIGRLKAAKVFVLPSTREGFSITTLEAMACGLPVITVKESRNAAQELVEDGVTGRIVGLSEQELADVLVSVPGDEAEQKKLAERCTLAVKGYDWEPLSAQLLQIYAR